VQKRLFQSKLSDTDVNQLAVVAMAGVAAEAMALPEVCINLHILPQSLSVSLHVTLTLPHALPCARC
jgi:capsular polysaccharide biosynthesis protein